MSNAEVQEHQQQQQQQRLYVRNNAKHMKYVPLNEFQVTLTPNSNEWRVNTTLPGCKVSVKPDNVSSSIYMGSNKSVLDAHDCGDLKEGSKVLKMKEKSRGDESYIELIILPSKCGEKHLIDAKNAIDGTFTREYTGNLHNLGDPMTFDDDIYKMWKSEGERLLANAAALTVSKEVADPCTNLSDLENRCKRLKRTFEDEMNDILSGIRASKKKVKKGSSDSNRPVENTNECRHSTQAVDVNVNDNENNSEPHYENENDGKVQSEGENNSQDQDQSEGEGDGDGDEQ